MRSRGVKALLQRVVHRAGHKRAQIPCHPLPLVAGRLSPAGVCEAPGPPTAEGAAERRASHGRRRRATCAEHGGSLVAAHCGGPPRRPQGKRERAQIHCLYLPLVPAAGFRRCRKRRGGASRKRRGGASRKLRGGASSGHPADDSAVIVMTRRHHHHHHQLVSRHLLTY